MNQSDIESQLKESSKWLASSEAFLIREFLLTKFSTLDSLFILHWHPGQTEEVFEILVNRSYIVGFELINDSFEEYEELSVEDYLKKYKPSKIMWHTIDLARRI